MEKRIELVLKALSSIPEFLSPWVPQSFRCLVARINSFAFPCFPNGGFPLLEFLLELLFHVKQSPLIVSRETTGIPSIVD